MKARPTFHPTYIRQWRKSRGLSLEQLSDRIETMTGKAITYPTLSRIERGLIAYTQPVLEAVAGAIGCAPADLLRSPDQIENELADYLMKLDAARQRRALRVLQALEREEAA